MHPYFVFRLIGLCALITAMMLTACGGGDNNDTAGPSPQMETGGDVERYCALVQELDRAGAKFFKKLERDENATQEDFEKAEAEFVETYEEDLDEIVQAAPPEIDEDVDTLLASVRARAGLGPKVDQKQAQAAERRVQRFEKENC